MSEHQHPARDWWPPLPAYERLQREAAARTGDGMSEILAMLLLVACTCIGGKWWPEVWSRLGLVLAAAAAGGALAAMASRRLLGWQVGPAGLRAVRRGRAPEVYPWESLRSVDTTARWLVVDTTAGPVRIRRGGRHGDELERRLKEHLDRPTAGPAEVVDEPQVSAWLGLGDGGALTFPPPQMGCGSWLVLANFATVLLVSAGLGFQFTGPALGPATVALLVVMLARRTTPLTVTAAGFRRGREWLAAWDDVRGITRAGGYDIVQTDRGSIAYRADLPAGERVTHAVRMVLEAKAAGATLPRMSDVPETALSRATPDEPSAERGLSLPD